MRVEPLEVAFQRVCELAKRQAIEREELKMRVRNHPVTEEEVNVALHNLHPNKDDWTPFERSNMERALYLFWNQRRIALNEVPE